jgi:hypothetical protein
MYFLLPNIDFKILTAEKHGNEIKFSQAQSGAEKEWESRQTMLRQGRHQRWIDK